MKLFGLTGGIGMGKSTSAGILSHHGIPVIDTDVIAREIVEPGQHVLAEVVAAFGPDLLDAQGKLRRSALAETVFSSPERLKQLEAILHPRIREKWLAQVEAWRSEGKASGVVVIPLLFETNAQPHFDAVVCTACSAATQRERLRERGWTMQQMERRLAAQWPAEKKIAASNHVVWTEGEMALHERQLERIFNGYLSPRR
jgi:dephospho-CoA kinase